MTKITGRLFLIVEAFRDGEYAKAILRKRYPALDVIIRLPTVGHKVAGVNELAKVIDLLLDNALVDKEKSEVPACVAVLHDADFTTNLNRKDYDIIANACKVRKLTKPFLAVDNIESWLLADGGVCGWLGKKPANWDSKSKPKETLIKWLYDSKKQGYGNSVVRLIAARISGDGYQHSPSLKAALQHLVDAPCTKYEE